MEEIIFEINMETKPTISKAQKFISCDNYVGAYYEDIIKLYEISEDFDLQLKASSQDISPINDIDFNHSYKNLIISATDNYMKLRKLSSNKNLEEICLLNGQEKNVLFSKFNPKLDNILISSGYKNIELWDITKYTNVNYISTNLKAKALKWNASGEYYGYIHDNKEFKINDIDNNILTNDEKYIDNFEFIDNLKYVTFHSNNCIKIWDIRNSISPLKEIKSFDCNYQYKLYDRINNYIYCFDNVPSFKILDLNNCNIIYENLPNEISSIKNIIILDNYYFKQDETTNFIQQEPNEKIDIIKIKNNNKTGKTLLSHSSENIKNKKTLDEYINDIPYKISDIYQFKDFLEIKNDKYYNIKNYMHIPEIKKELITISTQLLPERKKYVEEYLDENHTYKDIYDEYINYIKLIIRDNTNKKLLEKYLKFLKLNEGDLQLKYKNLENYLTEVEFYKVIFNKKEYNENFGLTKIKSEKENLIDYLNELKDAKNINDLNNIKSKIKPVNEYSYFNQPITSENEELSFFKYRMLLYYDIYNNDDKNLIDKLNSQSSLIKTILKKNFLNKENIIKNDAKFNMLIALIISPQDNEYNNYILNLIDSSMCTKEEIKEINSKLLLPENKDILSILNDFSYNLDYICKENILDIILNKNESFIKEDILYNYDYLLTKKEEEIKLNDIKLFLKDIFKKKTFKNIFKLLYNDEELKIINENSFIDDYIDNHLFLIPFKNDGFCGITDRFGFNTYIMFDDEILNNNTNLILDDNFTKALKISRFVIIAFHEFNHYIYSYILHSNNYIKIFFDSPRKKEYKIREGGLLMELILFGQNIQKFNIEQGLYVLNATNYDKTEKQFQKDFINVKNKNLNIGGKFSNFNSLSKNNNFNILKRTVYIKAKPKNFLESDEKRKRYHCVLGRGKLYKTNSFEED